MIFDTLVVIDFGSQTNQLITRRIREMGIYSVLLPPDTKISQIKKMPGVKGIILSGGPHSVYEDSAFNVDEALFELDIPILGICYGMQWMAQHFGGKIDPGVAHEYGKVMMRITEESKLFKGLLSEQVVWMSHGDQIAVMPSSFEVIAQSSSCPYAAIKHKTKPFFGVQFHPEVHHTESGKLMLKQFAFDVCRANNNWEMASFIDEQVHLIRETVQDKAVVLGLSGGVDSSVTALLLHQAIKSQLTCVFVDHGLLRQNEAEEVMHTFKDQFGLKVIKVDAKERFLKALKGVIDPEEKRKAIGRAFIEVFEATTDQLGDFHFLAQGTLYTDLIESGTQTAQLIKSHHNVGGLPKTMKLKLLEPLNTLFKDEVRVLGNVLKMPDEMVQRQPFPGPGLAIRILGEVTEERLDIVRNADAILREIFNDTGLNKTVWQYFTVLTPLKTVGVMGDKRSYEHVLAIRAVDSTDGMTADFSKIPYDVLAQVSNRIVNTVRGVNRVVYDITSKPPGTIEWE